jgi:hypothetical protein
MALAIALRVRIFGAERPARASLAGRARSTAVWSNGSNAACKRPQIALALAVESCCETTIEARPENPSARRRSGGRPASESACSKRGSALVSDASAASRSASV